MRRRAYPIPAAAILAFVSVALGGYAYATRPQVAPAVSRLIHAQWQGTFNAGMARSTLSRCAAPDASAEFVKLDYMVPPGTSTGAWTRALGDVLNAGTIDLAHIRVRLSESDPARPVSVALELKGTDGIQRIPLQWNLA